MQVVGLHGVKTDVDRGLIMIKGAVPGSKGGWVYLKDAVKRALPADAPMPGSFVAPGAAVAAEAPAEAPEADAVKETEE